MALCGPCLLGCRGRAQCDTVWCQKTLALGYASRVYPSQVTPVESPAAGPSGSSHLNQDVRVNGQA